MKQFLIKLYVPLIENKNETKTNLKTHYLLFFPLENVQS